MSIEIRLKRIYEPPVKRDGYRVLADRLWPRGVSKETACLDAWVKELAPSTALRKWLHDDPSRIHEFARRYTDELLGRGDEAKALLGTIDQTTLTLLSAVRDVDRSHLSVLRSHLESLVSTLDL